MKKLKDYYYILGLNEDATIDQIKKAHRKLSLKFHPDKNEGDKFFEERFKEIQEAYEVLSDGRKKADYDIHFSNSNSNQSSQNLNQKEEELNRKEEELNRRQEELNRRQQSERHKQEQEQIKYRQKLEEERRVREDAFKRQQSEKQMQEQAFQQKRNQQNANVQYQAATATSKADKDKRRKRNILFIVLGIIALNLFFGYISTLNKTNEGTQSYGSSNNNADNNKYSGQNDINNSVVTSKSESKNENNSIVSELGLSANLPIKITSFRSYSTTKHVDNTWYKFPNGIDIIKRNNDTSSYLIEVKYFMPDGKVYIIGESQDFTFIQTIKLYQYYNSGEIQVNGRTINTSNLDESTKHENSFSLKQLDFNDSFPRGRYRLQVLYSGTIIGDSTFEIR